MLKRIIVTMILVSFFASCTVIDFDTRPVRIESRRHAVSSSPIYYGWYGWWNPFWLYSYYNHYGVYNPYFRNYYFQTYSNSYQGTTRINSIPERKIVTAITKTQLKDSRSNSISVRRRVPTISSGSNTSSTSSSSRLRTRIVKSSSSSKKKSSSVTKKTIKKK